MDIREKTLVGLIGIFIVVTIILFALSLTLFLDSYRAIESKDISDDMLTLLGNINKDFSDLQKTTRDYGPWDDTYSFVHGEKEDFIDSNFVAATFNNLHINFIIITDINGSVLFGRSYNFSDNTLAPLPYEFIQEMKNNNSPLRTTNTSGGSYGFILLSGVPAMVASFPVLHSDNSGPAAGNIVMGRYLDEDQIKKFGIPSQTPPTIVPLGFAQVLPAGRSIPDNTGISPIIIQRPDENIITGQTILKDIYGNDALVLGFQKPREFYQQGKNTILLFMMFQLAIMLMMGLYFIYRTDTAILSRLSMIIADTTAISKQQNLSLRIRSTGHDEISHLADTINQMLSRIETTHNDLKDSEEKFRSFVQESADGYVLTDSSGVIIEWNRANETITGISREEAMGKPFIDTILRNLVPEQRTPEHIAYLKKTSFTLVETGQSPHFYRPFEIQIIRPDGVRCMVQQVFFPIRVSGKLFFGIINRDITERKAVEEALSRAGRKLNLLNTLTFQDIRNAVFTLTAYFELSQKARTPEKVEEYAEKQGELIQKINNSLDFAKNYQDMGVNKPRWQNVNEIFIYAVSHLDFSKISRKVTLDGLEIYADPLLEKAFFHLMDDVVKHSINATEVSLCYQKTLLGITIILEDNGIGIPSSDKEKIFEKGFGKDTGLGLFLVREILSITGITIRETGIEGQGARFEITVPGGAYRFSNK
jgi:PAS domain S-box-containing protein